MGLDIFEAERIIKEEAPKITQAIQAAGKKAKNEAELRHLVAPVLENFSRLLGIDFRPEHEKTLIIGRADTVYNRLVVEYEPPRSLNRRNNTRTNRHALNQVKQYIEELHQTERHHLERLAGVVLDGTFYIFARYREGRWTEDDPLPVSVPSTERFLRYLSALATEIAVTVDNLVRDFGENTRISRLAVSSFYNALVEEKSPRIKVIFSQWARQFNEICGYAENSSKLDISSLARRFGVNRTSVQALPFLFALHTYYATFIKLLAMQVIFYYTFRNLGTGLTQVASYPADKLKEYLHKNLEEGGIFKDLGLKNFLEGDFFSWYLEVWDEGLERALREMISALANYSLVTLDVDPEDTRDLLKKLYQQLMPARLRHNLGEYYTPDWLAERLLNQLEAGSFRGELDKKILDPSCGSGTFLVLAIRRMREYALEKMIPESTVLEKILANVVGFDLNPLAVISARTNYLLAIGDLLPHRKGEVDIPVYLADSILTPSKEQNPFKALQPGVSFKTSVGTFSLPSSLIEARYIDQLANLLEECVKMRLTNEQFRRRLLQTFPLLESKDERDILIVEELYQKLCELAQQGINGIWARIIKNAFAPLFYQHQFDYVVGNPPWVNWESLPEEYRQDTKLLWQHYGLFPHGGMDTILGKGKKDISMLLTYVAMDRYLKPRGKLGFVITQSVFKTSGAGQGFRRFVLGENEPVRVQFVDDLSELQPFEGASNRTSIIILQKGLPNRYPVQYSYWQKATAGKGIAPELAWEDVEKIVKVKQFVAEPVSSADPTSPWLTGKERAIKAVKKVLGRSSYRAHEGVNSGGANGVYWVDVVAKRPDGLVVISNITEGAKREVENVTAAIEPDLLYPLLRGRDVQKWCAEPSAYIIMAQDPVKRRGIAEEEMIARYPKTYGYLKRFEKVLRERRSRGVSDMIKKGAPFYTMFAVGDYTFAPYKVVWREQAASLTAAVVTSRESKYIIPDHKLMLVSFDNDIEAHYFCSVINSAIARYVVISYAIEIQMNPHILNNLSIPIFDADNRIHLSLANLSKQAHSLAQQGNDDRLLAIEDKIDQLAAQVWGITEAELKEIQESLAELSRKRS